MESITRTGLGALLQTNQLLNLPHTIGPNSTLNQKFQIHQNVAIAEQDRLSIKYLAIGNGGHKNVIGVDGISKVDPVKHLARFSALYNHLPFVLRDPSDDLIPNERLKYRLRRTEDHDGTTYVAYYLKVIDLTNVQSKLELRVTEDGVTTSTPFEHNLSDLSPTPPITDPDQVVSTTSDYLAATAKFNFNMTSAEVDEFRNVANIIYGDEGYAIISELALCSGVDRIVTGDFNGISSSYTDAIGVQVATFINMMFPATFQNEINTTFDIGSIEALLNIG